MAALRIHVERVDLWIDDVSSLPFDERRRTKLRRAIDYRRARLGPR
ncbi:MAG TPA: hypothetical protein VM198_08145 [Longimicrobiales bacterium]|nr:hypothetical protein [Longimicrobiales bacterium]